MTDTAVFGKSSGCTPAGIMRRLNAGKVISLAVTDRGRLRIESCMFEPSERTVGGCAVLP